MLKEFKEFLLQGNVVDMAVGIIIGAALGTIVTSLVNDVIMPPIGLLLGNVNFADLIIVLKEGAPGSPYATLASLAMENVRLYEQIEELAVKDGLTRLYTHRHFQTRMGEEILQAGLDNNIFLKKIGEIHGKTGYFRVTPGTDEENERFMKFIREYFG